MAFSIGQISANVTADDSGFNATMNDVHRQGEKAAAGVTKQFQQIGQQMRRTGTIMTAAVTAPVVAGMHKMTKEAALLEGAMDKFNVVFGDASDQMAAWVKEFRKEVPLATAEIVKHAASMQDLLVPMGIARGQAQGMSKDWLELAAALSAFNDVPVQQALEAIRSGIAGMSRPLRQFGIDARQTALQQIALEEGIIGAGEAMDTQARQQALLIQAYRQSSDALDGYEEQQGSLLFIQQEVTASIKDMAASYGEVLIPMAKTVSQNISSLAKTMESFDQTTKKIIATVGGLAAAIGPATLGLGWAIKITVPAIKTLRKTVSRLTKVMVANPYLAVAAAIAAIGTKAYFTEKAIARFHDEIRETINTADDWQTVNKKIAEVENRMNELADAARLVGVSPEQNKEFVELRKQLERLVDMRNRLTREELQFNMQMEAVEDARKLWALLNTDLTKIKSTSAGIGSEWTALNGAAVKVKETVDKILESSILAKQGIQEMTSQDIINSPMTNLPEKMFPPGSLGFLQQSLQNLRTQLREATDPETVSMLHQEISTLGSELRLARGELLNFGQIAKLVFNDVKLAAQAAFAVVVDEAATAFGNALFRAREYNMKELELRKRSLDLQEKQLRESLANQQIEQEEFNLKLAQLYDQQTKIQAKMAKAREGIFKRSMDALVDAAESAVKQILAEFAKIAIIKGIGALLGISGVSSAAGLSEKLFNNVFHKGGIIPGSGEQPIMAEGGEGVFTRDQMKAMGGMVRTGNSNMNTPTPQLTRKDMQQAFDKALGKHLQKLGPEQMFMLAQKGKFSF